MEYLQEIGGIWYAQSETLDEAIYRTNQPFGKWRKIFAQLFGYKSDDGVIYRK